MYIGSHTHCSSSHLPRPLQKLKHALLHALRSMVSDDSIHVPNGAEVQILTDSQSAIRAL